jgi:CheY-like chemotaxis protein
MPICSAGLFIGMDATHWRRFGGRILVVDDTDAIRELTARLLRRDGHDVREAADGPQALATLEEWPADLLVLDYCMPEMNGLEVLERIRRSPQWSRTGVIMVSASDDTDVLHRAAAMGARHYLIKSKFTLADLQKVIAQEIPTDRFRHIIFPSDRKVTYRSTLLRMKIDELQAKITARQAGIIARLKHWRAKPGEMLHGSVLKPQYKNEQQATHPLVH